jgi:hypothetical protein
MTKIADYGLNTLEAVTTLIRANHWMPALVVLYSGIDTLAWASLSTGDVTRSDFCRWVDKYMNPQQSLGCTALDLYAARCAIVHSSAAESRLSREGNAVQLWYVTDPARIPEVEAFATRKGHAVRVVAPSQIVGAFADAALQFSDDLEANPPELQRVLGRIALWLRFRPMDVTTSEG